MSNIPEIVFSRWFSEHRKQIIFDINLYSHPFIEVIDGETKIDEQIFDLSSEHYALLKSFYKANRHFIELFAGLPSSYADCLECDYSHRELQRLWESGLLLKGEDTFTYVISSIRDRSGYYKSKAGFSLLPLPPNTANTYVYLMIDERSGLIKIGKSDNPKYRESTLQSEQPLTKLIFAWKTVAEEETVLHGHYSKKRMRGEWFSLTPMDIAYIIAQALQHRGEFIEPDEYLDFAYPKEKEPTVIVTNEGEVPVSHVEITEQISDTVS